MRIDRDENASDDALDAEAPRTDEQAGDEASEPSPPDAESAPPDEVSPTTEIAAIPDAPGTQVDRLTDVLLAADQAAAEILDAARAEASEFVAETQRSTVERAESLRRETDNLMAQTSELTAKVIELTRATEQVMEGFRAELSLDAPEVREETLTPALPEPAPIETTPEPDVETPSAADEVAPEDTALAPEPVIDEPLDAEAILDEPSGAEVEADQEPAEAVDPDAAAHPEPPTAAEDVPSAPAAPEPPMKPGPPPSPAPRTPEATSAPDEPKRRGGLFGRLRGRNKEQSPPPAAPAPTQARTEESSALDTRSGPVTEGARLIARQMLATGLGEEEVKRQLREQFRLADPQAVLDSLRRNDRDDQSG